ncbi:YARHG domain-containing protein [Flavobacterium urocaniciphilum]|uniref:YARHG domain-containing protein n=1 Tax=Flavobacterium urocaniciphilum TaxID=1299341 RepID=A0A1H9B6G3_9FLAO|nr:YARHG domain-containing protein [Flavobacterium urocaniciphilum]SEP83828.1 YARHG domain-containing protein [Flavobacterium urocaniciphilum]
MKKIIYFASALALFSCKDAIKTEAKNDFLIAENIKFDEPTINSNLTITAKADLLGYWVGEFIDDSDYDVNEDEEINEDFYGIDYEYRKKITFSIDKIKGDEITGHSVVSGNIQKFKGKLSETPYEFSINVKEPGNEKSDGQFALTIKKQDTLLNGKWEAFKKDQIKVNKRKLSLKKRIFEYDPNAKIEDRYVDFHKSTIKKVEYDSEDSVGNPIKESYDDEQFYTTTDTIYHINPSTEILKKELVENLSKGDVFVLRNLIFARHGFAFRDQTLRSFFDYHSWYMPVYSDVTKDLTYIEKKNIALLLRYEQNAKEYYDHFGR